MKDRLTEEVFKFVGIPYKKWDCVKIVRHFYKCFFNTTLDFKKIPREKGESNKKYLHRMMLLNKDLLRSVHKPRFGDICLFTENKTKLLAHCGVLVRPNMFLHSMKHSEFSKLEFLSQTGAWGYTLFGYFQPSVKPEKIYMDHIQKFWEKHHEIKGNF